VHVPETLPVQLEGFAASIGNCGPTIRQNDPADVPKRTVVMVAKEAPPGKPLSDIRKDLDESKKQLKG